MRLLTFNVITLSFKSLKKGEETDQITHISKFLIESISVEIEAAVNLQGI